MKIGFVKTIWNLCGYSYNFWNFRGLVKTPKTSESISINNSTKKKYLKKDVGLDRSIFTMQDTGWLLAIAVHLATLARWTILWPHIYMVGNGKSMQISPHPTKNEKTTLEFPFSSMFKFLALNLCWFHASWIHNLLVQLSIYTYENYIFLEKHIKHLQDICWYSAEAWRADIL